MLEFRAQIGENTRERDGVLEHPPHPLTPFTCEVTVAPPILPLALKFWRKVRRAGPDECWEWTAFRNDKGYGTLGHRDRVLRASRVSWELHNGPIPDGLQVCHRCDNPPCVNPAHLFLGTPLENTRDKMAKGRHRTAPMAPGKQRRKFYGPRRPVTRTTCKKGHPFVDGSFYTKKDGSKLCKQCHAVYQSAYKKARKGAA